MNRNEGVYVNVGNGPHVQQQPFGPPAPRSPKKKYKSVLYSYGIVEIITGSLSIIVGIATLSVAASNHGDYYDDDDPYSWRRYYYGVTWVSQGIWCGVFAIVVGILGIRARSNPSRCVYNANMALSIIGANVMGVLVILSCIAAGDIDTRLPSMIAMHSILALLGFVGVAIMIIHSAYCCAGICCNNSTYQRVPVSCYPRTTGMQQPQLIQLANGQYMLAPTQMIVAPYPITQVPVVGGPVTYQQTPQGFVQAQVPVNQYFQVPDLQAQVAPAPSLINAGAPQPEAPVAQQATVSHPQQAAQAGKEEEANASPPGYSTLPRSELSNPQWEH